MPNCWRSLSPGPFALTLNIRVSLKRCFALDEREDLSPEEEALAEVLTLLIEDYEEKHHPVPRVSPHESLHALMENVD